MDQEDEFEEMIIGSYTSLVEETEVMTPKEWAKLKSRATLTCYNVTPSGRNSKMCRRVYKGRIYALTWENKSNTGQVAEQVFKVFLDDELISTFLLTCSAFNLLQFIPEKSIIYYSHTKNTSDVDEGIYKTQVLQVDFSCKDPISKVLVELNEIRYVRLVLYIGMLNTSTILVSHANTLMWVSSLQDKSRLPKLPADLTLSVVAPCLSGDYLYGATQTNRYFKGKLALEFKVYSLRRQAYVANVSQENREHLHRPLAIKAFANCVIIRCQTINSNTQRLVAFDRKLKKPTCIYEFYYSGECEDLVTSGKDLFCSLVHSTSDRHKKWLRVWAVVKGEIMQKQFVLPRSLGYSPRLYGDTCYLGRGKFDIIIEGTDYSLNKYHLSIS